MKKKLLLTISLLFLVTTQITQTSEEETDSVLFNTANNIILHLQELSAVFETASDGAIELNNEIQAAFDTLDVRDWEYKQLEDCISVTFENINEELDTCNQALETEKLNAKSHENQIKALEFEIKRQETLLTEQIDAVQVELKLANEKYATLAEFDEDRANELLIALERMKVAYTRVIQDKNDVVTNLRKLIARVHTYNITNKVGIEDLGSEICGDGFIAKLNKKNKEQE